MRKSFLLIFTLPFFFSCNQSGKTNEGKTEAGDKMTESADIRPGMNPDSTWTIKTANAEMIADPSSGGRIATIKINGQSFLTDSTVNSINWGSTLWPSPQSQWGWPPSAILDKNPYEARVENNTLIMTGGEDTTVGYSFVKEIRAIEEDSSFLVTYRIKNISPETKKVAAWEITRVRPGGVTLYPTGEGKKSGDLAPLTKDSAGITWFMYDSTTIPSGVPKLLADGKEGWIAQVNDGIMLIKSFKDVPAGKEAPGEAEIELYTNPDLSYMEYEQQGEYTEVKPGESLEWQVKWYIRDIKGSDDLAAKARDIVKK